MYFLDRKIKRNLCQNEKYLILEAVMCDSRLEHFLWTGYVHFGFWKKKKEKIPYGLTNLGHFCFFFDSHIGIILILYVVVYANCKNICRNVLETWQWYNFNKKFTYLVGNKKYQKVLEKSLEKWSRYAKTIFWLHFKIKLA